MNIRLNVRIGVGILLAIVLMVAGPQIASATPDGGEAESPVETAQSETGTDLPEVTSSGEPAEPVADESQDPPVEPAEVAGQDDVPAAEKSEGDRPVSPAASNDPEPLPLPLLTSLTGGGGTPALLDATTVISDLTVTPQSTTNGDYTTAEVDNNVIMERYHRPGSTWTRYASFVPSAKVTNVPEGAWVWFEFFNESPDVVGTGGAGGWPADDLDGDGIYLMRDDWDPRDNSDHSADVDCVISCSHPDLEPGQTVRFQVRVAYGSTTYATESRTGICFDHCAGTPAETNSVDIDAGTTLTTNPGADITCGEAVTPPNAAEFPLGLAKFCLDVADGSTHEVTLTYDTDLRPSQVTARKFDPADGTSVDIPGAVFTESGTAGTDHQLILTYSITDNGPLDLDPALGTIVDPVGPSAITVTFADQDLEDAVNDVLGHPHGTPVTVVDAASVTWLDAQSADITDLDGLEHLTGLVVLHLSGNALGDVAPLADLTGLKVLGLVNTGITDVSRLTGLTNLHTLMLSNNDITDLKPLAGLTDLTDLSLGGNAIDDVSHLAGLSNLTSLSLFGNQIADVSPLAGLTGLTRLELFGNKIADLSPLAGLTSLTYLDAYRQSITMPAAPLDTPTVTPVIDADGDPVAVTSTDPAFSYDAGADAWAFSTRGNKSLTWDTTVTIGSATDIQFSGTISQRITFTQAVPEDPAVTQAVCMNGDVVYPQITLPDTEGITYTIVGDVAPGETVTIEAVPADDDHAIYVDPASDWVDASGDHIYATLEITLDEAACDTPAPTVIDAPNGDLPVDDPCGADNATWVLPTGADVPVGFTWKVNANGLLTAQANDGYVFSDPSGNLDPTLREYGHAPDTNQACPANSDGDDSDQIETTGHALPNAGGPGATAGILGVALLGIGGLMVLTGRVRRQRA